MKAWTTQAERRLAEYLAERANREGFAGEEAAELQGDLLRHIHEEAELKAGDEIGLMQLEGILGRLEAGSRPPAVAVPVFRSRFWISLGTMKPRACLPSLVAAAPEHSRSKAAARCAAASPGLARAFSTRSME